MDKLKDRIREHQSSNHETLSFLGVVPFLDSECPMKDAEAHEQELHNKFVKFQRRQGAGHEWFTADPELMEYIEKNATPVFKPDVPESRDQSSNSPSSKLLDYADSGKNSKLIRILLTSRAVISLHDALVFPVISLS